MHIFNQYYARIQGYSYNYAHIQDNLYMHTFKEIYTRTYSRQFIFKTIYICNKEVPGHSIFIYASSST